MNLSQLQALVAVADEGHFTRAATRLRITQPTLSQRIRKLEDELELELVERTTRRVSLTEAGNIVVRRARAALAEVDAAQEELSQHRGLLTGRLVMGMTQTPGRLGLPKVMARFNARHPGIDLVVREGLSRSLADDVRAGRFDLAFLTDLDAAGVRGLERRSIVSERLVLLVARGHRLSARKLVRVEELRHEPFVSFREGATIRTAVHAAAARAGFLPHVAFEADEASRIRAIVAEGLGVSVLPESEAAHDSSIRTVQLRDASLVHRVSVAWRTSRSPSPAAEAFLALLLDSDVARFG